MESFGMLLPDTEGHGGELWVLQDYRGMKSSWNKVFKIKPWDFDFYSTYSCFTRNGEILSYTNARGLGTYDANHGSFKGALVRGDDVTNEDEDADSFYASPNVESLVSPRWWQ
ncbi:hypothetical protein M5689_016287 [Euphorbia peplus]|nr:hypothetical protein M5689_016287 [Euphorbia peplus]